MISQVHVTMKLPFRLVRNIGRFNTEWLGYLLSVILRETWSFDAEFFLRRPTNRKQIYTQSYQEILLYDDDEDLNKMHPLQN